MKESTATPSGRGDSIVIDVVVDVVGVSGTETRRSGCSGGASSTSIGRLDVVVSSVEDVDEHATRIAPTVTATAA
ncbi:MAG: hypothetical protein ACO38D_05035 [Ilumatobacteraceae bacterium]